LASMHLVLLWELCKTGVGIVQQNDLYADHVQKDPPILYFVCIHIFLHTEYKRKVTNFECQHVIWDKNDVHTKVCIQKSNVLHAFIFHTGTLLMYLHIVVSHMSYRSKIDPHHAFSSTSPSHFWYSPCTYTYATEPLKVLFSQDWTMTTKSSKKSEQTTSEQKKVKCKQHEKYMSKRKPKDFKESLRETWQIIFKLRDGFQTQHKNYSGQLFQSQEGKQWAIKNESAKNVEQHSQSVWNRDTPVDQLILEMLDQLP